MPTQRPSGRPDTARILASAGDIKRQAPAVSGSGNKNYILISNPDILGTWSIHMNTGTHRRRNRYALDILSFDC